MCGIAGAVGLAAAPAPERERALLETIAHRGPDAAGSLFVDGVWLGFRRLSILDRAHRADQPMVDEATGVALVFNGEIYDYIEHRATLERLGHAFLTTGDTEVLLRGYLEWGEDVFAQLNGMFAVAVHDPRSGSLLLARDRFGEKPLHVGRASDGAWWFGSEIRTLLAAGAGSRRVDLQRVKGFLAVGDVEDPVASFIEGIAQVPPGIVATLDRNGLGKMRRFWHLDRLLERAWTAGPASDEEVLAALDRAVAIRLRSDVTVGTSLSGGLDSSTIVASMRAADPDREIHTFTASFPGRPIDEWNAAALVAERYRLTTHRVTPTVDGFLDDLDALVDHQGGPIESPTVYAQWCVMQAAHEAGVTVLLDGQGADETWGGYPKYVWFGVGDLASRGHPRAAIDLARQWQSLGGMPAASIAQAGALTLPGKLRPAALRIRDAGFHWSAGEALATTRIPDPQGEVGPGPLLLRAARADLGRVLLPRLLRYADRNSMAWSREVRLPFLDPVVVEMALRSGWLAGLQDGWTKHQLRRAVAPRLPESIVWRRDKVAYQVPDHEWLGDARVRSAVHDAHQSLRSRGVLAMDGPLVDPWRALSLAQFLDRYGLEP